MLYTYSCSWVIKDDNKSDVNGFDPCVAACSWSFQFLVFMLFFLLFCILSFLIFFSFLMVKFFVLFFEIKRTHLVLFPFLLKEIQILVFLLIFQQIGVNRRQRLDRHRHRTTHLLHLLAVLRLPLNLLLALVALELRLDRVPYAAHCCGLLCGPRAHSHPSRDTHVQHNTGERIKTVLRVTFRMFEGVRAARGYSHPSRETHARLNPVERIKAVTGSVESHSIDCSCWRASVRPVCRLQPTQWQVRSAQTCRQNKHCYKQC